MSRGPLHALQHNLAHKRFERAYYFYGDEDYEKDRMLQELVAAAVDASTRDFNLDQRRGAGLDVRSLGALLATPPVLTERRVVMLRDVGSIKKDARAVLEQYLRNPAPDIVLVLVSSAGEKADATWLQQTSAVEFATPDASGAAAWAIDHAREVHGANMMPEAAQLLVATVGPDLAALAAEVDKGVSYAGADIDVRTVEAIVGVRQGETLGDLLGAVAQRRAADALGLVAPVLAQPKNGLVPVLGALGAQLLAIGVACAARQGGASAGAVRGRLWDMLKGGNVGLNTGGPWGEAVERWASAAPLWTEASIQNGLRALLVADRSAKDSRIGTDEQILSNVVLELCGDSRRAAA